MAVVVGVLCADVVDLWNFEIGLSEVRAENPALACSQFNLSGYPYGNFTNNFVSSDHVRIRRTTSSSFHFVSVK